MTIEGQNPDSPAAPESFTLPHPRVGPASIASAEPPLECRLSPSAIVPAYFTPRPDNASDPGTAVEDFVLMFGLSDIAVGWHAASQPDIAADYRTGSNGNPTKDCRPGIDHDIMLHDRMPLIPLQECTMLIDRESFGSQRDRLIQSNAISHDCCFANDDSCSVINEKALTNRGSRMDVNTCD